MSCLSVDPQEIVEQRAKGWPDFHPEDFCHRCGQRNIQAWVVDGHAVLKGRVVRLPGLLRVLARFIR